MTADPQIADPFDAPLRREADDEALLVDLDGYAGPLDLLLDLARRQKVDLRRLSMLALAEQFVTFVERARAQRLEVAADYLVMAAWLTFLKSRLLLPAEDTPADEPTGDELAARLAFQLQRLEAMRAAAEALTARPQLGIDFFARGAGEGVRVRRLTEWRVGLYDLLKAYARQRVAAAGGDYQPEPPAVYAIEAARARLERMLGGIPDWTPLADLARPQEIDAPAASIAASAFNAVLELAKEGKMDVMQTAPFAPVYVRRRAAPGGAS